LAVARCGRRLWLRRSILTAFEAVSK
jgi:hypothetical protein